MKKNLLDVIMTKLRDALRQSPYVHLRENPAPTTADLVVLMDRFLDGCALYPLEWDDFISWENESQHVEGVRISLSEFEPLLFSNENKLRVEYDNKVIIERNKLAIILGISVRSEILDY